MELWQLLAHRHWFTLKVFDREVRLCARCTGYVAGFFTLSVIRNLFGLPFFHSLKTPYQLFLCFLSIIPLTSDWLTQSWGWRDGNNRLRFLTGALLGLGVALLSSSEVTPYLKTRLYCYTAAIIVSLGSLRTLLARATI